MKKICFISLILLFSVQLISQKLKIGYEQGGGKYAMTDLKELNEAIQPQLPFETQIVSNFPMYWYFRPSISLVFNKFEIGLVYVFQSTGSRISAKDYSGEYRFDTKIDANCPGIFFQNNIYAKDKLKIAVCGTIGISLSNLDAEEYLSLSDNIITDDKYNFKCQNFFAEPGIKLIYPVKFIELGANAGFIFEFGEQAFYTQDNKDYVLQNPSNNESVKPCWSGIQFGLSVSFTFGEKQN